MKFKKTALILALTLAAGAAIPSALPACAEEPAEEAADTKPSFSEELTTENAELFLPETYEQYLPLENPKYMTMNDEYVVVSDGKTMYLYNKAEAKYDIYNFSTESNSTITKIQFAGERRERLFFTVSGKFYEYDFANGQAIDHRLPCSTFLIVDDTLYSVRGSDNNYSLYYYPLDDLEAPEQPIGKEIELSVLPKLTYEAGTLYYITDNYTVMGYDITKTEPEYSGKFSLDDTSETSRVPNMQFACAYHGYIYYTVTGNTPSSYPNGIYRTELLNTSGHTKSGQKQPLKAGTGFTAIDSFDDKLYCIYGKTVRELTVTENGLEFSGYEIAASSDSPYRLSSAGEVARTKNLVAFADKGNKRVTVYNRQNPDNDDPNKRFTVIDCKDERDEPYIPEHIAIDKVEEKILKNGKTLYTNQIAVSSGDKIFLYTFSRYPDHSEEDSVVLSDYKSVPQSVKGMTFVYGECYFIMDYACYGYFNGDTTKECHFTLQSGSTNPEHIGSDIYGNLYVAFGKHVTQFKESDFKKESLPENSFLSLTRTPVNLSVDYQGNVWYLTEDGKLCCNDEDETSISTKPAINGKNFVYLNETQDYPVSFALAYDDDEVFFNFGDYVVKTKPYTLERLPALNKITAGEAQEKTFELRNPDKLFVEVPEGQVGVRINLDDLKAGTTNSYFSSEGYFRTKEEQRGVLLYEPQENGFYVIALYDEETRNFSANIFDKSHSNITFLTDYYTEANDDRFIASNVSLCSAPCLFPTVGSKLPALAELRLLRGAKVTVLGYAVGVDREYALVNVIANERENLLGYVPVSFLSKTDPLGVAYENYMLGFLKGGNGVILLSEDGTELAITELTQAKIYDNGDGTFTAVVVKDGVAYSNTVQESDISRGETDALRISLIVVLSVLALVIICGYVFLLFPHRKKKK